MSQGDTLICSRYTGKAAFEVVIFASFKLKIYYFSEAVILVQFFMKFGVLGILCRIFIAYSIANHLNVNFSILFIWILEESSDFSAIDKPYLCDFCSEGFLLSLGTG